MRRIFLSVLAAASAAVVLSPAAGANELQPRPWLSISDGGSPAAAELTGNRSAFSAEDPPSEASGLPAARENIDLVGSLNPQKFGGVRIGEIADLAVFKGYAYLNSWDGATCDRGGTYVVDIRTPSAPKEVAYIPPKFPFYHGEGAHVISVDTPAFKGDILAVNDETWGSNVGNACPGLPPDKTGGGFDLYDVTDPANPKTLVQGAGDRDGGDGPLGELETTLANSYHSVFVWQSGPKAYLVASDNVELEDVDIFDITNPKAPVQVGDYELATKFPQILNNEKANGNAVFNHDMVVKPIASKQIMAVSNWDSGYVQIDVTDPANPIYVTDTTNGNDTLRPALTAEGNSHESEFSADNQFLLGADEDFAPFRSVLTGPPNKPRTAIEGGDNPKRIADLPDAKLNGPTVWAGNGCEGAAFDTPTVPGDPEFPTAPANDSDPNTDRIALIERGGPLTKPSGNPAAPGSGCGFAEKIDNAAAAGFDGVVIYNQVRPDDGQVNMNTTGVQDAVPATIPAVQMRRVDALGADGAIAAAPGAFGTAGPNVSVASVFDGWGYGHLYDAKTSAEIDAYAIPESQDPRFASDFGDLTIHEFATDPTEPIAYAAYYGGGMRTFRFNRTDGLVPTGKYIADDGNGSNFWGVESFTLNGERYFAGSDRDFGLQIFRYTGAGAAQRPVCTDSAPAAPVNGSVSITLSCTDANDNALAFRIVDPPKNGKLGPLTQTRATAATRTVTYTPNTNFSGVDSFSYTANDGAADAVVKTVNVAVVVAQATATPTPSATPGVYYYGIKKKPRLTATARPKRDKKKPFVFRVQGRLILPSGVTKAAACKGTVRIIAKKGSKTVGKRRVGVKSTCKYKGRVKLRKSAGKRGKAKFQVQFLGNNRLFGAKAKATAKYGKKKKKK